MQVINQAVQKKPQINLSIKKEEPKIVDSVGCGEIESIAEYKDGKLVMCRCWRSSKFPYCDGSHAKHNKETGDNVGPLIIKK
jgi:CDGSH-type Zn-finger protein